MNFSANQNRVNYDFHVVTLTQGENSEYKNFELQETSSDGMQEIAVNDDMEEFMGKGMQEDGVNDVPQEPYVGMEFDSHENALLFYNVYAQCVGFITRIGGNYKSRSDHTIISRDYLCSREGYRKGPGKRMNKRDGCKAMLTIKKRGHKWRVTRFEKHHNHPLDIPGNNLLRSQKRLSIGKKEFISTLLDPKIDTDNGMNGIIQSPGGSQKVRLNEQYPRNYVGQNKLGALGVDARCLLNYFKLIQARNSAFYHAIQVDKDYALSNIFWVDARSRFSYMHFHDAIAFDKTYIRKGYSIPFVSIHGVNHHQQSILFGCALLSDQSESTFAWLFQTWLEAMNYQPPSLLITDHDNAIKAAVVKVFPETRHRYYKDNILERLLEKLSHIVNEHSEFQQEIADIVNCSQTRDGFQEAWQSLLQKYNLEGNQWLQYLYIDRYSWVPVYLKDTFFAGLLVSKPLLDKYINQDTTLTEFIKIYDREIENLYDQEVQEDFDTVTNRFVLKTPLPMEEHASRIFSRKIFCLFQEEIVQSFSCNIKNIGEDGSISMYSVKQFGDDQEYTVSFNDATQKGDCTCKMFPFEGILCRHVFTVLHKLNFFTLPSHYILKRWTKEAKQGNGQDSYSIDDLSEGLHNMTLRYDILYEESLKCIEDGACSAELFHVAMHELQETRKNVLVAKQKVATLRIPSNPTEDKTKEQC